MPSDWNRAFLGVHEQLLAAHYESPSEPKFRIPLQDVRYCGTIFRLHEPIDVSLYVDQGAWVCANDALASFSCGDSAEHAVHAFCEDFTVLWHEIAESPDESLAPDALKLKGYLLSLVRSVERDDHPCP